MSWLMCDSPTATVIVKTPPPAAEERTLAVRFARGDERAFDEVVERYQARIAGLAYRLLGWPDDVEDARRAGLMLGRPENCHSRPLRTRHPSSYKSNNTEPGVTPFRASSPQTNENRPTFNCGSTEKAVGLERIQLNRTCTTRCPKSVYVMLVMSINVASQPFTAM